jgi:hypothetical protein
MADSYGFAWSTSDTIRTVNYFDHTTDTYPDLAISYMLYDNPDDWQIFEDYITADAAVTTNE